MPRPGRLTIAGVPQLVVQWGHNRQRIFKTTRDYWFFRDSLRLSAQRQDCAVHGYVLMSDHILLLATPQRADGVARLMQSVGRRYVRYFNESHDRTGTLWEGRYQSCLIEPERYFLICLRYIESSPVQAGLCGRIGEFQWSSYGWHGRGVRDDIITDHAMYRLLGTSAEERQSAWRALCRFAVDRRHLLLIERVTRQGGVLGSERYVAEIERALDRRLRPGRRGRPRKRCLEAIVHPSNHSDARHRRERGERVTSKDEVSFI